MKKAKTRTEDEFVDRMAAELEHHEHPITLVLRPGVALEVAGLLQLALKHPKVTEGPRRTGWLILEHIKGFFQDAPAISEVLRRGDAAPPLHSLHIGSLRETVARGASHECEEWIDLRGRCALCDRRIS